MAGRAHDLPIWHTISLIVYYGVGRYIIYLWRMIMFAMVMLVLSGYGFGYEGYRDGKLYVGLYTPGIEYGYVITDKEIYLDTVFEKN